MSDYNEKFWPFFVVWIDKVQTDEGAEGNCLCRSLDEANELARIRVLFGSQESFAVIYSGKIDGRAKMLHKVFWKDREVVRT
jgi:hypothetical protein